MGNSAPLHRLSEGHLLLLPPLLGRLGVELHLQVCHLGEAGMAFVPRIDEYLRLRLGELPQPDHPLAGRDLISEGLADLHRGEGQRVPEVAQ